MRIAGIDLDLDQILGISRSREELTGGGDRAASQDQPGEAEADEVEVSEAARERLRTNELVEAVWSRIEHEPGIRREVVEKARQRLREGHYDEPQALRKAAAEIFAGLTPAA